MSFACERNHLAIAELLLDHGASVETANVRVLRLRPAALLTAILSCLRG